MLRGTPHCRQRHCPAALPAAPRYLAHGARRHAPLQQRGHRRALPGLPGPGGAAARLPIALHAEARAALQLQLQLGIGVELGPARPAGPGPGSGPSCRHGRGPGVPAGQGAPGGRHGGRGRNGADSRPVPGGRGGSEGKGGARGTGRGSAAAERLPAAPGQVGWSCRAGPGGPRRCGGRGRSSRVGLGGGTAACCGSGLASPRAGGPRRRGAHLLPRLLTCCPQASVPPPGCEPGFNPGPVTRAPWDLTPLGLRRWLSANRHGRGVRSLNRVQVSKNPNKTVAVSAGHAGRCHRNHSRSPWRISLRCGASKEGKYTNVQLHSFSNQTAVGKIS